MEIRPRKCSVNDLLRDCVDLLSPELSGRGIRCHLDLTAGLSEAYVDAGILSQVFVNLIRNAVEMTKEKQDLIISTAEDVSEIQVAFKHPASKLKSRDADLMFLPFDEGGQSIGLPLSYRLLKDMGGLLSYEKEMDKIVFTLSLPKFDLESVRDTENV